VQSEDPLSNAFDAVVMFTWSNWRTEPRSNRYHYATRLARHWPVYFVQKTEPPNAAIEEAVDGHNIRVLHLGENYGKDQSEALRTLLESKGVKRPLYWVYNSHFVDYVERFPGALHIYHGTEDYFGTHSDLPMADGPVLRDFKRLLPLIDLSVAVTSGVANSLQKYGQFEGPVILLRNGCDAAHWAKAIPAKRHEGGSPIAIYQGGINARLDFALLGELADNMPDWQFHFCGDSTYAPQPDWNRVVARPNVRTFGQVHPDKIAVMQARATAGIIPFRQISTMQVSLPLKAYEYVASGLPVVTIPIDELDRAPDLFARATNAAEFAEKLRELAPTRWRLEDLQRRLSAAKAVSYDSMFEELLEKMAEVVAKKNARRPKAAMPEKAPAAAKSPSPARASTATQDEAPAKPTVHPQPKRQKRVLVSYGAASTHVQTTMDYLMSLSRHLSANVKFVHVTHNAIMDFNFSDFDAVFQSYCARWPFEGYVSANYADALRQFQGPKLLAVQDEYDRTNILKAAIRNMGFDVVLTCVPKDQIERVYPQAEFPGVEFVQVLTGYVPEDMRSLAAYAMPIRERPKLIGYRGRDIGGRYGKLALDKLEIGERVKAYCDAQKLVTDIDSTEESRIYGHEWFKFIGSCRATLGTESGSNVFDFDGSIERNFNRMTKELGRRPSYEEFLPLVRAKDNSMQMGQVSPKIFEAAALRTAMVLLKGRYSDIIRPGEHYIELAEDYSNIEQVIRDLNDFDAVEEMTARTFEHLVGSQNFSYAAFGKKIDALIDRKLEETVRRRTADVVTEPVVSAAADIPPEDLALLLEKPTATPQPRAYYDAKIAQREANIYKREVARLNQLFASEIPRITGEYEKQGAVYRGELDRLNGEISRLNQVYGDEIKRIVSVYEDQAATLVTEIGRLNGEINRMRDVYAGELTRVTAESEQQGQVYAEEARRQSEEIARISQALADEMAKLERQSRERQNSKASQTGQQTVPTELQDMLVKVMARLEDMERTNKQHLAEILAKVAAPAPKLPEPIETSWENINPRLLQDGVQVSHLATHSSPSPEFKALMRRHRMSVLTRPVRKSVNAARNALRKSIPKVKRVVRATPGVGALAIWIHQTIRR
jgi:hypothetical protein